MGVCVPAKSLVGGGIDGDLALPLGVWDHLSVGVICRALTAVGAALLCRRKSARRHRQSFGWARHDQWNSSRLWHSAVCVDPAHILLGASGVPALPFRAALRTPALCGYLEGGVAGRSLPSDPGVRDSFVGFDRAARPSSSLHTPRRTVLEGGLEVLIQ